MTGEKVFITFGGGGQNYIDAGHRIIEQALSLNIFDNTIFYTDKALQNDINFWSRHKYFIESNPRGYGYWLWKPYIIHKTMEMLNDGDIILYLDCGCELDIKRKHYFAELFEIVTRDMILGTYTAIEKGWNKMDLLLHLDMYNSKYINTYQHQAGALMFLVCPQTRFIVKSWYDIGCDYHMIDDSPSIAPNVSEFIEHRHDQAIFSLLTKKCNIFSKRELRHAIEYERNKTGVSKLK